MASDLSSFFALAPAFPELLLAIGAIVLLLVGVFGDEKSETVVFGMAIGLLAVTALLVILNPAEGLVFNGGFIQDTFARYVKVLVLAGAVFALMLSISAARDHYLNKFEYPVLVVLAVLGMMLMISANDLMSLYVGLELQSLSLYVIAAFKRDSSRATEAGLKYFVLGALSSGMLLYGSSLLYGFTGHTQIDEIARAIALDGPSLGLSVGLVFVLAGLAFKISAVPFHMWTPDVYEGVPTPVTALFASAPKIAAIALLIRIVFIAFEPVTRDWQQVVIFISVASMILASFAAIGQKKLKRLIAYSSIGHAGFALVGLSAGSQTGVEGVSIYMAIYLIMTVGFFACVLALRTEQGCVEDISDLAGVAQTRPFIAAGMAITMFSFIGLPPLAGFFAKWGVFLAAVEARLFVLAVIGVLASAVSAYYYLRVVRTMYFDEPNHQFLAAPRELNVIIAIAGILMVTYFLSVGGFLTGISEIAAGSLF